LIVEDGKVNVERYWQIQYTPLIDNEQDAVHLLREALQETIQLQMISDVPVGAFLSGGIDSSGVTALMSASASEPLQTFTIGFEEESSDERDYARIAANRFSTLHHENVLSEDIACELIPAFSEIYDEPFFDSSGLPTHFVSQIARSNGLKVILTGDGGDEVFAGYRWYDLFSSVMASNRMERFRKWIERYRKHYLGGTVKHSADGPLEDYFNLVGFLSWDKQRDILTSSAKDESQADHLWLLRSFYKPEYPIVTMAQYFDIHTYLVDDILTKVDRASMACGLEARVPLLDYKLVELAFTIDAKLMYHNSMRKYLLKKTLAEWVPVEILTARKKGFSIPLNQWMGNYLRECTLKVLDDGSLVNQGILTPDVTQSTVLKRNPQILWLLFTAELWARRWVEGCSSSDIQKIFFST
jgi:asparagine synthase (glutamine-hydrolysing)